MAYLGEKSSKGEKSFKRTVPWVREAPGRGSALVMVTAYDCPQGRLVDEAGVDLVLVGDSVAMVSLGHRDTLGVTMEEMLHHVRAVRRGVENALLVADMPYGSYHLGPEAAVREALRFIKEAGAEAVKLEGHRPAEIAALVDAEVPVMAHLGLTPQSLHRLGGYRVQGRDDSAAKAMLQASRAVEEAGAFSLVLECVPQDLASLISEELEIPTIGIGAGVACRGQVLVLHDLLGFGDGPSPRFVRRFADLGKLAREGVERYAREVREGSFPGPEESYGPRSQDS